MSKRRSQHAHAPASVRARRRANFEQLESRVLFAAAIQVAETLLVNVDATSLPAGTAQSVPNTGSLGGVFAATGGGDTVPVIGRPAPTATSGTQGIRLLVSRRDAEDRDCLSLGRLGVHDVGARNATQPTSA